MTSKSFEQILGEQTARKPAPRKITRGFGTTDTLPRKARIQGNVDDAHLTAMRLTAHKRQFTNASISHLSNQYMLEDTKSRADTAFHHTEYVIITREEASPPDFAMVAKR